MRNVVATVVLVAAVAVAAVVAGSGAFNTPSPTPATSPSSSPAAAATPTPTRAPVATPVLTFRPTPSPIDTNVVAEAVVVPLRSANLATSVSGLVDAVYVRDGSEALNGQLLMKLDQSTYLTAVEIAQEDATAATAAVRVAELNLEQLPPDASPGQIESVQAQLILAESNLELARSKLSGAQTALQQTEVRAPFAGTIADVAVSVGEQAIAGQTVISIGHTSSWLIETTDVSELEVVRLAVGDRASVTFTALPDVSIEGTVDRIQVRGSSDEGGVVFAVAIRPDTHIDELRWGMSATVRITPSG
jgi:RND family efflux transporter MFP subunit